MLKEIVRRIWQKMPQMLRVGIIRTTQRKFTVSAAVIVTNEKGEILLLNHVLRPLTSWGFPGGFIGPNEPPEDAIRRELREETGLELEELRLIRVRTINYHVEVLFRAKGVGQAEVNSREIIELGWFDPNNMPEKMSKTQKAIIEKVLNGEI